MFHKTFYLLYIYAIAAVLVLSACIFDETDQVNYNYTITVNSASSAKIDKIEVEVTSDNETLLTKTYSASKITNNRLTVSFSARKNQLVQLKYDIYSSGKVIASDIHEFSSTTRETKREKNYEVGGSIATCCDNPLYKEYDASCKNSDAGKCVNLKEKSGDNKTFTDKRDGKVYKKVTIKTQVWMAENLNYTPSSGNSWCYGDSSSNCATYGRLYDRSTTVANNHGNGNDICPEGWHLPSDAEWKTLEKAIGMDQPEVDKTGDRGTDEGKQLKAVLWNGTDKYGFAALPAGYRDSHGSFNGIGSSANFWTNTEYSSSSAWVHSLVYDGVFRSYYSRSYGLSVRCSQD